MKNGPDAPLFMTYNRYGFGKKRVHEHTVAHRLKMVAEMVKIKKPIHPHALRHARITDLAKQGFSEMELRIIAGWEAASGMPAIYVHMSGDDVERKVLQKAGLCEEEEFRETSLESIRCPRCQMINTYDSLFCKTCSQTMTDPAMMKNVNMAYGTIIRGNCSGGGEPTPCSSRAAWSGTLHPAATRAWTGTANGMAMRTKPLRNLP